MVKNKAMQPKAKAVKKFVERLKAPQLKALQYLLAANSYVTVLEGLARRKTVMKVDMER